MVAAAVTPAATVVTAADPATRRAVRERRARRADRDGGAPAEPGSDAVASGGASTGFSSVAGRGTVPASLAPISARRATRSAAVTTAAPPTVAATSALPHRPLPGVTGPSSRGITRGVTRLATPIDRLARVSRRS